MNTISRCEYIYVSNNSTSIVIWSLATINYVLGYVQVVWRSTPKWTKVIRKRTTESFSGHDAQFCSKRSPLSESQQSHFSHIKFFDIQTGWYKLMHYVDSIWSCAIIPELLYTSHFTSEMYSSERFGTFLGSKRPVWFWRTVFEFFLDLNKLIIDFFARICFGTVPRLIYEFIIWSVPCLRIKYTK